MALVRNLTNPSAPQAVSDTGTGGLGYGVDVESAPTTWSQLSSYPPLQGKELFNSLVNVVNDLSNTEASLANPNIKGNPLYGYGTPALSFDGSEYPYDPDAGERMVPDNRDTLTYHFWENGLAPNTADFERNATQAQKDQLAREFTLLRNINDYARQQRLDNFAADQRQRSLYGDTLVDLLQNTPKGQQILDYIPAKDHRSRERNITGPGQVGFIQK